MSELSYHKPPSPALQNHKSPEMSCIVPSAALVLRPPEADRTWVKEVSYKGVLGQHLHLKKVLKLPPKPMGQRNGKPHLVPVQDLGGKKAPKRFLENELSLAIL